VLLAVAEDLEIVDLLLEEEELQQLAESLVVEVEVVTEELAVAEELYQSCHICLLKLAQLAVAVVEDKLLVTAEEIVQLEEVVMEQLAEPLHLPVVIQEAVAVADKVLVHLEPLELYTF
jgi:hypothetical protein